MSARDWPFSDSRPLGREVTIVRRSLVFLVAVGLFAASALPAEAAPPARAKLARSDSTPGLQHADKLGRADPRRQLTIGVNLALRNEAQLEAFIAQVSDRKSPNYGHYLTPAQFAATYGPTQTQVQQVVDQLRASGLAGGPISSNRTIVEATGPVSAVEAAFGVTISDWHDRNQNRDFFGNDTEPTLPSAIASDVVGVAGLNNHYPLHRLGPTPKAPPGGGPVGGYTPNDLKKAYDVTPLATAGYNGSGQALGLFELDGFTPSNITTYDTQYALGSPAPTKVLIGGVSGSAGPNAIEVELDIEVMHAIAPASAITVWEGPNTDPGANATYNAIVTSNTTKSNSTSWGICEPNTTPAEMTTLDNIFKQAAAQGQSFFAASGDNGAYDCGDSRLTVDSPANDPYMTGTGGTALTLNADGTYQSESAWSDTRYSPPLGSGGGLSSYFARPSWQTGPGVANSFSNGMRQVPDVALDADPRTGYSVYVTNAGTTGWNVVGGTSAAAPAWAAYTGVYNQYAVANGKPNLGYANPSLYSTGSNAQAYPPYHDVTTGDNLFYPGTANWDYPTGWGSFDGNNLARDLAGTLALTSVQASNITSTSAVIAWQTDHPATSQVDYGTATSYGSRVVDTTNASNHSLTLSGLTGSTTYHFKSTSTDIYGNSGSSSDATFTTLAGSPGIGGSVRNASGTAVPNTWIYVYQGGTWSTCCTYVAGAMTDTAGSYSINLPSGTYKLFVGPPSPYAGFWYGGTDFGPATAVAVTSNVTLNFNLNPVLSGTVRNASGTVVPNTWVYVYQGGTGATCCTYIGGGLADASGTYNVSLPAGTYKLFVSPPSPYASFWYGGNDFGAATPVQVTSNKTVNMNLGT